MFQFSDPDSDTPAAGAKPEAPGKVRFDDRGNAVYEWRDTHLVQDGDQAEKWRERALLNPTLALIDDGPAPTDTIMRNKKGLRVGYNPYESGQLDGKQAAKKRDIRELSKWIELQRSMGLLNKAGTAK